MNSSKYILTPEQRNHLRYLRKRKKIAAESISHDMKHGNTWLAQIERGEQKSIDSNSLCTLLSKYLDLPFEEIESSGIKYNFLKNNTVSPIMPPETIRAEVSMLADSFSTFLESAPSDDICQERVTYMHFIKRCLDNHSGMTSFFCEPLPYIYEIFEAYSNLPNDQCIVNAQQLKQQITKIIKEHLDSLD